MKPSALTLSLVYVRVTATTRIAFTEPRLRSEPCEMPVLGGSLVYARSIVRSNAERASWTVPAEVVVEEPDGWVCAYRWDGAGIAPRQFTPDAVEAWTVWKGAVGARDVTLTA